MYRLEWNERDPQFKLKQALVFIILLPMSIYVYL